MTPETFVTRETSVGREVIVVLNETDLHRGYEIALAEVDFDKRQGDCAGVFTQRFVNTSKVSWSPPGSRAESCLAERRNSLSSGRFTP